VLCPAPAFAHKLNVFATVEGKTIHGKAYFRGGAPAQNVAVKAFDPAGEEIGRATTDGQGRFSLDARFCCDYRLLVDAGEGHGGEYVVVAAALPTDLPPRGEVESPSAAADAHAAPPSDPPYPSSGAADGQQIESLRAEIVQLQAEVGRYEQRVRLSDILGGIGYIVGLTGAAFYFLGLRRKHAP
jgi:nickel transport protein